jgi:hypothetical protein
MLRLIGGVVIGAAFVGCGKPQISQVAQGEVLPDLRTEIAPLSDSAVD